MIKTSKKAFTLVELIVVIVILAVLATIAFISLQDYPVNARDSKRKAEIKSLADKVNIINAQSAEEYSSFVTNTGILSASVKPEYTSSVKVIGDINFDKVVEDPTKFWFANEKYKMFYVEATTASGNIKKCFEVVARDEWAGTWVFESGNCGNIVTSFNIPVSDFTVTP